MSSCLTEQALFRILRKIVPVAIRYYPILLFQMIHNGNTRQKGGNLAMFQMTIERALQEHSVAKGYCLYLFRDGETILYVGRSHRPLERLREHLGWGEYEAQASHLGDIILKQFPGSLAWTVEFYTLAECQDLVAQCRPEYALWFEEQIKKN